MTASYMTQYKILHKKTPPPMGESFPGQLDRFTQHLLCSCPYVSSDALCL